MTIISKSERLSERQIFQLTKSGNLAKVKDNVGRRFDIVDYVLYTDVNTKTGEEIELLAVITDDGDALATNSKTVIRSFKDMIDVFPLPITDVEIVSSVSKNGRDFYNIILA